MGVSIHSKLNERFMVKVWQTGGFIVNTNIQPGKQYYNQRGHGACIFGLAEAINAIHFEEELWLQDTRYALPDDMVFFYKLYLNGNQIAMNRSVRFVHLDAGSSLINTDKYLCNVYASARNGFVFWYRFIYLPARRKITPLLCVARRIFFTSLFAFLKGMMRRDLSQFKTYLSVYKDGLRYVKSKKFKELPIIRMKCKQILQFP